MNNISIIVCILLVLLIILIIIATKTPVMNESLMNVVNGGQRIMYSKLVTEFSEKEDERPIYIFYHIATIGRWKEIVKEQMNILINSGLYDKCEGIWYGCNCEKCPSELSTFFKPYDKVRPLPGALIPDQKTYENGTVNAMLDFLRDKDPGYVFYMHSKGVTARHPSQEGWRQYMMYWNVRKYHICIDLLSRGFNTTGVCHTKLPLIYEHYSGNFWWARSEYLLKKPKIKDLTDRYNAERFLLRNDMEKKNVCIYQKTFLFPYIHTYMVEEESNEYSMVIF